jgi:hypothetical protein
MGSKSEPVLVSPDLAGRLFHFVMIKPTHYDDDGYPIQWFRSAIPSNTLACLNGLAEDAHRRNVLGPDVEIRLHTYDETNRRVQPDRIIREIPEPVHFGRQPVQHQRRPQPDPDDRRARDPPGRLHRRPDGQTRHLMPPSLDPSCPAHGCTRPGMTKPAGWAGGC